MNAKRPLSLCAALVAGAMLIGCGGEPQSGEAETTSPAEPQANPPSPAAPTNEDAPAPKEETSEPAASIPEGFPEDIHLVADPQTTDFKEIGNKKNLILEYPASDIDAFVADYQKGMADQGWEQVTSSKLPIGTITNYAKEDRKCTVSISPPKDNVIKVAIILPK